MKKAYQTPEMTLLAIQGEEICTASPEDEQNDNNVSFGNLWA